MIPAVTIGNKNKKSILQGYANIFRNVTKNDIFRSMSGLGESHFDGIYMPEKD
ncbi:hypothetical protein KCTCHS21_50450 [Cohnella abietis]|uniref:Uncharacterized protein n=1 Tax=Cohnella abietis TaxID=2507935 RepID=A0A3T1DBY2_9BACL|nr:hypothetical protein KCTCHS21_50450 [Cohnella abietis]